MAATIEELLRGYQRHVNLPWDRSLAPAQRVWMAVYDKSQERRLRFRIDEFRTITQAAGYTWQHIDLTTSFADWMAGHDYSEAYFEEPDFLGTALPQFTDTVVRRLVGVLDQPGMDETVVGLSGLASLYGLTRASKVLEDVTLHIQGKVLVFYPGEREGSNYRLLDARDGWDYHAVPIV